MTDKVYMIPIYDTVEKYDKKIPDLTSARWLIVNSVFYNKLKELEERAAT